MTLVVFLLLLSVVMNTVAQVSLKRGLVALAHPTTSKSDILSVIARALTNRDIMVWLAMFLPATVLWIKVLSLTDLSFAYPFQSLSLVLISLSSVVVLGERMTKKQWGGLAFILLGIILISRS
ncbi:MAG: EamA family transporter [Deltaproteobacteria bacterium]|nr:EamA family transporter [Deltaproteobacteria bacterium]